jgi:hypothetical protein
MIDLKIDEMYAAGALNSFIDDLREWIGQKEAAIEKRKHKSHMAPILADLQKHVDETKAVLVEAERYLAGKTAKKA